MTNDKDLNVLNDNILKKYLNKKDFKKFKAALVSHEAIDNLLIKKLACAITLWAKDRGVSYFTHYFFPLTEKPTEKLVSFLGYDKNGDIVYNLDEKFLIKGEADASSFPCGNERSTCRARGYSVWDMTSPIFITEENENKVMHIPAIFCSYNNLALDDKLPLLKASEFLKGQVKACMSRLGYKDVKDIKFMLGCEQEYFLIDEKLYSERLDLKCCGRTLFGGNNILIQEGAAHYLSEIETRVKDFMFDLSVALEKMGIIVQVQHNEVAPSQHEIVPVFREVNIACDNNMLIMSSLGKVAARHGLKVLLHEKPFKGVNGSGKHNNISICSDSGINLFDYEKTDKNLFMISVAAVIAALDKHYDLIRLASACPGNEERLGGNEAPTNIMSVYLGDEMLEEIIDFISGEDSLKDKTKLKHNLFLPAFKRDFCDRNRTSPFAFTGNKFELRSIGSSQNPAFCNMLLQTIIAHEFKAINSLLDQNIGAKDIVKKILKEHERIIFNGDCYSPSWRKEAERRGLNSYSNTLDCFKVLLKEDNIKLLSQSGVMNEEEIEIKYLSLLDNYISCMMREAKTMQTLLCENILPSLEKEDEKQFKALAKELSSQINTFEKIIDIEEKAIFAQKNISQIMKNIREKYDALEIFSPLKIRPFPSFDEILFKN